MSASEHSLGRMAINFYVYHAGTRRFKAFVGTEK